MNGTDKLIEEQLATLPQHLQRAIAAVPWKTLVQQIGKGNGLNSEQIESLERETMFIIYAFEPAEDYVTNIIREINVSEEVASVIAQSVAEKILDYISNQAKIFEPQETKEEAMKRLMERRVGPSVPEIAPEIHPMIEPGEKAHDVKPVEQKLVIEEEPAPKPEPEKPEPPVPDYRYPGGKDPYREPAE